MHLLPAEQFPLPDEFTTAYKQADILVFETDIRELETPQGMQLLMQHAMYSDGRQLNQVLSAGTYQQLQQFAPQNAVAYLEQARLWHQLGQPQQALTVLQQALQQGIVHADIQLLLAQQAAAQAQWQRVDTLLPAQFINSFKASGRNQPWHRSSRYTAVRPLRQRRTRRIH